MKDVRALGGYVRHDSLDKDIYACASTNGSECAVILTHYNDNDETPAKTVELKLENLPSARTRVEYYLVDEEKDGQLVRSEVLNSREASLLVDLKLFDCLLITLIPIE